MRTSRLLSIGAVLIAAIPSLARAQNFVVTPVSNSVQTTSDALMAVHDRLRELIMAEESYYSSHARYTTDLSALQISHGYRDDVAIEITSANDAAWSARGTHRAARGKNCVVYIGDLSDLGTVPRTQADRRMVIVEASPTCDAP